MPHQIEYLATNGVWEDHGLPYTSKREAQRYMGRLEALNPRHTYRVVEAAGE